MIRWRVVALLLLCAPAGWALSVDTTTSNNNDSTGVGVQTLDVTGVSTAGSGEFLSVLVGVNGATAVSAPTCSGASLTWTVDKQQNNNNANTPLIWECSATAAGTLTNVTITVGWTGGGTGSAVTATVVTFIGANGIGAKASGTNAAGGTQPASMTLSQAITTTVNGSMIFAIGQDWDFAWANNTPTVDANSTSVFSQQNNPEVGAGNWVQRRTTTVNIGTYTLSKAGATTNSWTALEQPMLAVEITPAAAAAATAPGGTYQFWPVEITPVDAPVPLGTCSVDLSFAPLSGEATAICQAPWIGVGSTLVCQSISQSPMSVSVVDQQDGAATVKAVSATTPTDAVRVQCIGGVSP